MTASPLLIWFESLELQPVAAGWAEALGAVLSAPDTHPNGTHLRVVHGGLQLAVAGFAQPLCIRNDSAELRRRAVKSSLLLRACGVDKRSRRVLDLTAGLGRDAFTLAYGGARVHMVERDLRLWALLADALQCEQSREDPLLSAAIERLSVQHAEARDVLNAQPLAFDVVYLDPMYAETGRALPKQNMQMLGALLGREDEQSLLAAALAAPVERVVLKRPLRMPPLMVQGQTPHHSLRGERVRFDVYGR